MRPTRPEGRAPSPTCQPLKAPASAHGLSERRSPEAGAHPRTLSKAKASGMRRSERGTPKRCRPACGLEGAYLAAVLKQGDSSARAPPAPSESTAGRDKKRPTANAESDLSRTRSEATARLRTPTAVADKNAPRSGIPLSQSPDRRGGARAKRAGEAKQGTRGPASQEGARRGSAPDPPRQSVGARRAQVKGAAEVTKRAAAQDRQKPH